MQAKWWTGHRSTCVRSFLNPLSIRKIPGLGEKSFIRLGSDMGIKKIFTLAQIHPDQMNALMGKSGLFPASESEGINYSPVVPYTEQKEHRHPMYFLSWFHWCQYYLTTCWPRWWWTLLFSSGIKINWRPVLTVTIRYSNFEDVTKQAVIPYTSLDGALIQKAKDLFKQVYTRRMLLRLVGVRLSGLVSGFEQIDMYSESAEQYSLGAGYGPDQKEIWRKVDYQGLCFKSGNVIILSALSQLIYHTSIPHLCTSTSTPITVCAMALCRFEKLVQASLELRGWGQMAITDINNSTGVMEFMPECNKQGLKPVGGIEFRRDKKLLYIGIARNKKVWRSWMISLTWHNLNQKELPDRPFEFC